MEVLKVSSKSNPNATAGALAGVIRQEGAVEVQVVGAGALNQAVKAIAIARGFLASTGFDLVCVPEFKDILIDGERRTAIRFHIEDRQRRLPGDPGLDATAHETHNGLSTNSVEGADADAAPVDTRSTRTDSPL